jgi:precorrin-2 dehydrogenase/sirohydrochlorin ferrochelatase
MGYLSFNLQIAGRAIFVIGGGPVAARKVTTILAAGAELTVFSPVLNSELQSLRDREEIRHLPRKYRSGDLAGAFMVIAATSDREANRAIAAEAESLGILAEITDDPFAGNVTSPAIIRQGDLSIAISTNNLAPALSAAIKNRLLPLFGPEYAKSVRLLGAIREKLLTEGTASTYNTQVYRDLAEKLPTLFAAAAVNEIDSLLQKHLGTDCGLASFKSATGDN